jgi:predicted metalloprotease with PDZ domain
VSFVKRLETTIDWSSRARIFTFWATHSSFLPTRFQGLRAPDFVYKDYPLHIRLLLTLSITTVLAALRWTIWKTVCWWEATLECLMRAAACDWPRNDTEWLNSVREIARSERSYWADTAAPFLVTLLQIPSARPGATTIGGTGRSDAFAMFATRNADAAAADQVIAHEMMHSWIPYLIGGVPDKDEALAYWLSEGFTDWAARRALVRGGIWQPEYFVKVFNEALHKYDSSPVKGLRNSEVLQRFWQDSLVQKLPYQRGMLLATRWDVQIYRSTQGQRSFHDVLRRMRDLAKQKAERGIAVALLIKAMRDVANLDIASDIEKYVDAGEMLPLDADAFGMCAVLRTRERASFDRGFDAEATIAAGSVIQGVNPDGNAHRAGLRNGMKLIAREAGEIGNSEIEIRYSVMDGEVARSLAWLPAGTGFVAVREMAPIIAATKEGRAACVKRLGG